MPDGSLGIGIGHGGGLTILEAWVLEITTTNPGSVSRAAPVRLPCGTGDALVITLGNVEFNGRMLPRAGGRVG